MNYLIAGATGFIGRELVGLLLNTGHSVNYLGRKRSTTLDSRAAFHLWKPEEPPPLNSVPRFDAMINLVGEPVAQRWTEDVKRRIYESRVIGTRKLVSSIGEIRYKPSVLVNASAVGYYGDRGDEILTETSSPGNDFLAKVCVDWEREAQRAHEFGVRVVTIRTAVVLGRDGGALKQMLPPFRLGAGGRLGTGRQWMPWIHMRDLLRLYVFAVENQPVQGPLNGSGPQPVTNAEFTQKLANVLHRPAILPVPKFALKMAFGELADFMLASERVIPATAERLRFNFEYPEVGTALQDLLG